MAKPRIVGGSARGRPIKTPRAGTRPSPARLREALFDMLAFRDREKFLDLYSGSGAVGLEAASRGWSATCVDVSAEAVRVIAENARALGLAIQVVRADALRYLRAHAGEYAVVFAAPPYRADLAAILAALVDACATGPANLLLFQHPVQFAPELTGKQGNFAIATRKYGSNALTLIEFES